MKWYQLNIEGQQPPVRISHASTILLKQQQDSNGASCSNYSVNELGTIAFYGGGINGSNSGLNNINGNNYTDLAFLSVGIGATDDIAKPQNTQSMGKLNKLLGSNVNNSNAANSSNNSNCNNSNNNNNNNNNNGSCTTTTTTTTTTPNNNQQKPTIGFVKQNSNNNNNNINNNTNNNNNNNQIRKTYSKLPMYTGSTIFHWENSISEGENPLNRLNHSLTSLNNGSYKGKILLIGGQIVKESNNNITRGGNNNNNNNNSNSSVSLSNDIHLLDCESLYWIKCTASGTQPEPRHSHFVHQISNDTVLLFGGIGESNQILSDIHLLNISNQNVLKWTQPNVFGTVFNLKDKDYKVCFSNGFLWIIISECMEMYRLDINTFRWSIVVYSGNFPRGGFASEYTNVAGCFGNIIILLVENEIFFFDTVTLEWGELEVDGGERPIRRKYHTVSVIDSMLIVVGGQSELPLSTINTRDIEMIDLKPLFIKKKIIK